MNEVDGKWHVQDIAAITAACDEVRKSPGFQAFIELTLLTCNFMGSSSSVYKQTYAFKVSSLKEVQC